MFFINNTKDTPLLQELIREGVFNSALWESLVLPSEGYLMDALIANHSKIPERGWIDWLVRKHGCTRIPTLEPTPAFIKAVDRQVLSDCLKSDCYPLLAGENHLYIGVGRPDYPEIKKTLLNFYKKHVLYSNALPLNEIRSLRELCRVALQSM